MIKGELLQVLEQESRVDRRLRCVEGEAEGGEEVWGACEDEGV
jgi:hypothetical protein